MTTRAVFTPEQASFNGSAFPQLKSYLVSNVPRMVLAFDASAAETCYWPGVAPQGFTGPLTAVVSYRMASGTSGGVAFDIALEAISSGDATDTDAGNSFDTANTGTDAAVPGTAGYVEQVTVTLTNADSIAAGDVYRLSLTRAVANAADTATGDCEVLAVELRDAA